MSAALAAGCDCGSTLPAASADGPRARFVAQTGAVEWTGLAADQVRALRKLSPESLAAAFPVFVAAAEAGAVPAVGGTYSLDEHGVVRFTPRFPFSRGMTYRAVHRPSAAGAAASADLSHEFTVPAPPAGPATFVERVFPSADLLPENQLKFYIHFSAAMGRAEAYANVRLIDDTAGKTVDMPFLELEQELWDPTMTRFTLFFDPGRIKRGLKPREEFGPALEEGKTYTFVIDAGWADAQGRPLRAAFRKTFRVGPPDDAQPDVKKWKITAPAAGSRDPVVVAFGEPMDSAMMLRVVRVVDAGGREVVTNAAAAERESRLLLTPAAAWAAGKYELVIDTVIEDLAGNSLRKPFEVDVFRDIQRQTTSETVRVGFEVR